MKRVLMTNFFFAKYTGSELHVLEMARLFEKRGYEVTIAVFQKAYPLLEKADTIRVVDVLNEELEIVDYDIVFVQHYPVLDYLCCRYNISYKKLIVSKLSVISDLEYLPVCVSDADLILCVSDECADDVYKTIVECSKVRVFKNSVSEEFFEAYSPEGQAHELKRIAIISNHVPVEIQEFAQVISGQYELDYIGVQYSPRLVDAELLKKYDLIITIGRTVQQCFAAGIPVYVYDYFGGPGYIDDGNFDEAEKNNFSGRGNFGKKTALELKEDIELNYEKNLGNLEKLNSISREEYSYDFNFEQIYQELLPEEKWARKEMKYYYGTEKQRMMMYTQVAHKYALSESITSQLYFDYGEGFKECESITWQSSEAFDITRTFEVIKPVKRLRFDPCDIPSECSISEVYINGKRKEGYSGVQKRFFDSDSQFIVELSEEEQALNSLSMKFIYKFRGLCGEEAMSDCFKDNAELKRQLSASETRIKELEETIVAIREYYKMTSKNIIKRILGIFKR